MSSTHFNKDGKKRQGARNEWKRNDLDLPTALVTWEGTNGENLEIDGIVIDVGVIAH